MLQDAYGRRLLLVGADVIWFSDALSARLRRDLARRMEAPPEAVVLAATHTHGSPQPDSRFRVGVHDAAWVERLEAAIHEAAGEALAAAPVDCGLARGKATVGPPVAVCRRRMAWHISRNGIGRRVQNLPNPRRPVDSDLSLLIMRDAGGQARAAIVHFCCHPVALPLGDRGGDYPGLLRAALARRLGTDAIVFLQGFAGDIRPRLLHRPVGIKDRLVEIVLGRRFRPSRSGDAEWIAEMLTRTAEAAVESEQTVSDIGFAARHATMPLVDANGREVGRSLDVTVWGLADDLTLVFASGEMLSGLSLRADVVSVGYANGMVGYVAPEQEYAGGGYEVDGFLERFGMTARLSPSTGKAYEVLRDSLVDQVRAA